MAPQTKIRSALRLLGVAAGLLALAGCGTPFTAVSQIGLRISSSSKAKADGTPISLRQLPMTRYRQQMPKGQVLYSLRYWSRGVNVQAYLDVPPGRGAFPLLVFLHGGDPTEAPGHYTGFPVYTPVMAAESSNAHSIVFIPNYGGYGPSQGDICSPYDCFLDAENGIKALSHIHGLHVKEDATYPFGFSLGGYVAMMMAEHDPQVRAIVLDSPWPGALAFLRWADQFSQDALGTSDLSFWALMHGTWGNNLDSVVYRDNSVNFSSIHTPVLIIGGEQDTTIPPSLVQFLYRQLQAHNPYVELDMVPGGHAPITMHVYRLVQKWLLPLGFRFYLTT